MLTKVLYNTSKHKTLNNLHLFTIIITFINDYNNNKLNILLYKKSITENTDFWSLIKGLELHHAAEANSAFPLAVLQKLLHI